MKDTRTRVKPGRSFMSASCSLFHLELSNDPQMQVWQKITQICINTHFTAIGFLKKQKKEELGAGDGGWVGSSSSPPHLLRLSNLCDGVEELLITGGLHCGCASFSGEVSWKAGSL